MRANIDDAVLCIEAFGDPGDPAVLLIMGAAASMDRWEEPFCRRLAAAGRRVIRYDHRDTGGSTSYPPGAPGYTADDLRADALRVLDHLGVERAHVVGLSMGGGLAQELAVLHPERVRTLTLMSTTSVAADGPELPPMSAELQAVFSGEEQPEPDWADREAVVAHWLEAERPYAGGRGLDEPALRELLGRAYDRTASPASAGNHFMVAGTTEVTHEQLTRLDVPTLVLHGADDPFLPAGHGAALAAAIPGARLRVVDGLGHELPRWAWDEILPALIAHTA